MMWECAAGKRTHHPGAALRRGEQAGALIWVHTPDIPATAAEKFLGDFKGDFFKNPP